MLKTGSILKKMRTNRNVTQADLCKGITARTTYSKIENNLQEPNYEILIALLKAMNYEISDFAKELYKVDDYDKYYKVFLRGIQGEITITEAKKLFNYADKRKYFAVRYFHFYGIITGHLINKYPTAIKGFTPEDKSHFKKIISTVNNFYSLYDLKIIGDFSPHFLSYKELIALYNSLPPFFPLDYGEDSEVYRSQIHKIYNNFCDIAIFNDDIKAAKKILQRHKKFAKIHPETRYKTYIKLNELTINYIISANEMYLEEIKKIADFYRFIDDTNTARAMEYQVKVLHEKKYYDPLKATSYDA